MTFFLWLCTALGAPGRLFVGQPIAELGYDETGETLWVKWGANAIPYVDGVPGPTVRAHRLLADGRGPVVIANHDELLLFIETPARTLPIDLPPRALVRMPDRGFVVVGPQQLVRMDAGGAEVARVDHACERLSRGVRAVGEEVWFPCDGGWWAWRDGQVGPQDGGVPQALAPGGLVVKDQQILDDKGTVLIDLPFRERLSWTDRSLVARSPDGRTLAAGVGYFVELADLDTGRWRAGPVHHRRAEVLATSPEGGSVLSGDASGLRVLWRRNADPVVLPDPTWPHREPDRDPWLASGVGPRVPHSAAFSPDGQRLVSTFNGGVFTVHDGSTGAERWVGNADPKTLDGPHYRFDVVPAYRGPSCMTGEKRYLSAPTFTPDGRRLITAGAHDGKSAVLVWDADLGTVQHRFLFDSTALLEGFRADGRLQVLAGDTLFALHVGPGDGDPEVIANDVRSAWLDGGELKWIANGEDARAMYRVRPQVPAPSAPRLEEGRVVFPAP